MLVKAFLVLALAAVAMSAPTTTNQDLLVGPINLQQQWTSWKTQQKKTYETPDEEAKRLQIFEENLKKIVEHNEKYQKGEVTWSQGLNQFADLTQEEFANIYLMKPNSGLIGTH